MELVGTVLLDKYSIEQKIGEGGMGYVFRAKNLQSGTDVAIKILKEELSFKSTYLRRFRREIRASSLMNHKGIVKLYDEGQINGKPFLVMEYVEGQNLRQWAKNKRRAIPLIVEKFEKICEAIDSAHRRGIIHRDLKPENVLVTYTGQVKIMDFGLARQVQESSMITAPGTFIGTVVYTSPEQASGKTIDHRCDIYAIGIMLFEMVTGKLPFKGEDPIAVLFQHIHNEAPFARELNKMVIPELDDFIQKVLSKNPDERPQSALEMAQFLRSLREPGSGMLTSTQEGVTIGGNGEVQQAISDLSSNGQPSQAEEYRESTIQRATRMIPENLEVTFMMLELMDFVNMTDSIDYPTVQKFLDEYNRRLEDQVLKFDGKVILSGGHRAFFLFSSYDQNNQALAAVEAAKNIMRAVQDLRDSSPIKQFARIPLDIGVETSVIPGAMTLDENVTKIIAKGSLYHTVTLIQNLSKALNGNTILTCGTTYEKIKDKISGSCYKKMFVKGKKEPIFVYRIDW